MSQKFIKNKEDFVCEKCGILNIGDGYTNHCFNCLWSKHVDNFPGDRGAFCGGLMSPITIMMKGKTYIITHRCEICGSEKNNKSKVEDKISEFLQEK